MDTTSVSLLQKLQASGDDSAWDRFVDLYTPLIFHCVRKVGLSPSDSADAVQEVLATLVACMPDFQYDSNKRFRAWLRTVSMNRARDLLRRKRRMPGSAYSDDVFENIVASPETPLEELEYQGVLVRRALELMQSEFNPLTWKACWLHVAEGRKAADIAHELGLTTNAVYIAKCRVMRRLREEMNEIFD